MKIELELSEENEGTHAPYWIIIDPKTVQGLYTHHDLIGRIAFAITGVFFSREAAKNHLEAERYNFSKHAEVWCCSGHASFDYTTAIKKSIERSKNAT